MNTVIGSTLMEIAQVMLKEMEKRKGRVVMKFILRRAIKKCEKKISHGYPGLFDCDIDVTGIASKRELELLLYALAETSVVCKRRSYEARHSINPYMDSEVAQALQKVSEHNEHRVAQIQALEFSLRQLLEREKE